MKKLIKIMITAMCMVAFSVIPALACTSYYVGSELTADGTTMYGRTEDISAAADKVFKVIPAKQVGLNAMYEDPTGATNFKAPIHVTKTYRYTVVRDCEGSNDGYFGEVGQNEKGVSMSGTTSSSPSRTISSEDKFIRGGVGYTEENVVDYVLCQAATAKEAVQLIKEVVETIGAGEGNGIFVADKNEVWYVEVLSGHNMCAIKMPKDKAAIIPNCFMIGEVDTADTDNVIASENLITLAKNLGTFVDVEDNASETTINVKASYAPGYASSNADRIRGGQWLLSNKKINTFAYYEESYKDMFFDCSGVTVEKLYELAGFNYEGMSSVPSGARVIGTSGSVECHIMQIDASMPYELATVQWLCMCNADFSTFVPFYTALITDTSDIYKMEAFKHTTKAAYWVYRDLGAHGAQDRTNVGAPIKNAWKTYMTKMQDLQKTVNQQMLEVYNNDKENLESTATTLGMAIGEETYNYALTMLNELDKWFDKNNGSTSKAFTTTVNFSDLVYDISMVQDYTEAQKKAEELVAEYQAKIAELEKSVKSLELAIETTGDVAEDALETIKTLNATIAELNATVKSLNGTITNNNTVIEESNSTIESLNSAIAAMEKTISDMSEKLEAANSAKEALEAEKKAAEDANEVLEAENKALKEQNEAVEEANKAIEEANKKLQAQLDLANAQLEMNSKKATTVTVKVGKKSVTASWKEVKGVSGYEVSVSTSKSKTSVVKSTTGKSFTKKSLKAGKKYYVKVRAYKTVNGEKVYGKWSAAKLSKKVK